MPTFTRITFDVNRCDQKVVQISGYPYDNHKKDAIGQAVKAQTDADISLSLASD